MKNDWIDPYYQKPETYLVVHAISKVGKEFDIVEAWWTGDTWIVPSVRSKMVTNNIIRWRLKPKIPQEIIDKYS